MTRRPRESGLAPRRNERPAGPRPPFWRRLRQLPHRLSYPVVGLLLSLASPLGLLALRWLAAGRPLRGEWVLEEIDANLMTYGYLMFGALILLVLLGRVIGRAEDRLRNEAITDTLTGLFNRRYFDHGLATEIARARRRDEPLSLLLLDMDALKALNDRSGHRAGDLALRHIATSLERGCRATDWVARLGGDEFVLLAPNTAGDDALALAERLRRRIKASAPRGMAVTVSVGVAELGGTDELDGPALLDAADEALYRAKAAGRDCSELGSAQGQSAA